MRYSVQKIFLFFGLLSLGCFNICFQTLKDLRTYANNRDELPLSDNESWIDPDYSSFHRRYLPTILERILDRLGLQRTEHWSAYRFSLLLKKVVRQREKDDLKGRKIAYIKAKPGTQFCIWCLQGAFHSFIRCLEFLYKKQIINDKLEIIAPDFYFVFNGGVIGQSPYRLEILEVALLLLERNPGKVLYLRGEREDKNQWMNYGLKRELITRIPHARLTDYVPLGLELGSFFQTLPLALYISDETTPDHLIRISYMGRNNPELREEIFGNFFSADKHSGTIFYHDLNKKVNNSYPVTIVSLITNEDWKQEYEKTKGLRVLSQDRGSMAWSVFSSPTSVQQRYFNFFYDAFVILTSASPISASTLTYYYQHVKLRNGFKQSKKYNVVTGAPVTVPQPSGVFTIGSTMALERGVAGIGLQVYRAMTARINAENKRGGINGYRLQAIIENDDYTPLFARQNIGDFIHKGINTIVLPVGSPTLAGYLDYLKENQAIVLFPVSGSNSFRNPELKNIVHVRASYDDELKVLIDLLIKRFGCHRFAFFYADDDFGRGAVKTAHELLKSHNIKFWKDIPYIRGSVNFKKQVAALQQAQPDAIGFISAANSTIEFIRQVGIEKISNIKLFGISFLGENSIRSFIKRRGLTILLGAVVPNPQTSTLEIVKEYRKLMDKKKYPYHVFSLEAYIGTSLLLEMLRHIEPPFTKEKIIKKLESLDNYYFKGLRLSFNPQTRSLATSVWVETGDDREWFESPIS